MNRNEYIKRILPAVSELGDEKTEAVMNKIAAYLVDAGEENEQAALNALGVPEIFAHKFVHTNGEYEIPPFVKPSAHNEKKHDPVKNEPTEEVQKKHAGSSGKFYLMLALLVVTSPIWFCFLALFVFIALVYAFAVTAILLLMTVGGAAMTIFGVLRLFSILPVGLVMTGAGLALLAIASVGFIPLLNNSVRLFCDTVKDIYMFVSNTIKRANSVRLGAESR